MTLLLSLALAAATPTPAVKAGVDAWQAGDYPKAAKAWMDPAAAGDADAQFNLAQAYKLGRGVPMDMRQAEAWYRKAAEQGHDQAGAMLGLIMFQNGDRKGALPWIQKAAEHGDPRAQYVYGTALFNGDEIARDYPRGYAMMTKAAAAGLPQARTSLTQMDQFIPLADRQAGLALARGGPRTAPAQNVAAPTPRPAVTPAALPPSRVAAAPVAKPAPAKPAAVAATKPAAAKPIVTAAANPAPAPVAGGKWRIQLGAYSDAAAARTTWSKLSQRPALKALTPFIVPAGPVTRLQAGPFASRAAASQACKAATGAGATGCFPVRG